MSGIIYLFTGFFYHMDRSAPKIPITFADLTHTGQLVATNVFPFGVSLVAAYAKKTFGDLIEASIFKYPNDMSDHLSRDVPRIACFSNYLWNNRLSTAFSERIKRRSPETAIVFGGPNYPLVFEEQAAFLSASPIIDFYIFREGERAFANLIETLMKNDFNIPRLKARKEKISGVHYFSDGELICGDAPERIRDLSETPSPYLMGMLDKFFDDVLVPIIETNRGCPFSCTFCYEGNAFFRKINCNSRERINAELDYIVERVKVPDVFISDSNFGMFKEDLETSRKLARLRKSHSWPKYVNNSSGKNQKDRVMEAARILDGALVLTVSIQSADETVLNNVNRKNISLEQIIEVGKYAATLGANSYCEIILAMPGDSKQAHFDSVFKMVDAEINDVLTYQMMMLPGTDTASRKSRKRHQMTTRYRILPRCFGEYEALGEKFSVVEVEEICVANETISFQDYLDCRALSLTMELFYNGGAFREVLELLGLYGIKGSRFVSRVHDTVSGADTALNKIYEAYLKENQDKLWEDRAALETNLLKPEAIDRLISGELGSSELYMYKAQAFFRHQAELHEIAFAAAGGLLKEAGVLDKRLQLYLDQLSIFCLRRKGSLCETERETVEVFDFDFIVLEERAFKVDPLNHETPSGTVTRISHTGDQKDLINAYLEQYGTSLNGLGRLLLRSHVNKLYRKSSYAQRQPRGQD